MVVRSDECSVTEEEVRRVCAWLRGIFFFHTKDGIRGPLWSRGLGDVYVRQCGLCVCVWGGCVCV